jgi:hypothetical protein
MRLPKYLTKKYCTRLISPQYSVTFNNTYLPFRDAWSGHPTLVYLASTQVHVYKSVKNDGFGIAVAGARVYITSPSHLLIPELRASCYGGALKDAAWLPPPGLKVHAAASCYHSQSSP